MGSNVPRSGSGGRPSIRLREIALRDNSNPPQFFAQVERRIGILSLWMSRVPKYCFNLKGYYFIADRSSHECDNDVHAHDVADEIAGRLVKLKPELLARHHMIVVRDENDREIYCAELIATSAREQRLH